MAGGQQIGGDADRAVFIGAVGGGDCGGGEGVVENSVSGSTHLQSTKNLNMKYKEIDFYLTIQSINFRDIPT